MPLTATVCFSTVNVQEAVCSGLPLDVAVIVTVPKATKVTKPLSRPTVATDSSELVHATLLSVASSGVTAAVSVSVLPTTGFLPPSPGSLIVMPLTATVCFSTVNVQEAVCSGLPLDVAVIVTVPKATKVTKPLSRPTVATDSSELVHATLLSVASSGVTAAVSVSVLPTTGFLPPSPGSLIVMPVTATTLLSTVKLTDFVSSDPSRVLTVIVTSPGATKVTRPLSLLTVATATSEERHSTVLLSAVSGVIRAPSCRVVPSTGFFPSRPGTEISMFFTGE